MSVDDFFSLKTLLIFLFCWVVILLLLLWYMIARDVFNKFFDIAVTLFDMVVWNFDYEYEIQRRHKNRALEFRSRLRCCEK